MSNAEVAALRRQVDALNQHCARLQAYVDVEGAHLVNTVASGIVDPATASDAVRTYDPAWFDRLPYSAVVIQRIARRIIDALDAYPYIDASHIAAYAQMGKRS